MSKQCSIEFQDSTEVRGFSALITGIAIVHTTGMPVAYSFGLAEMHLECAQMTAKRGQLGGKQRLITNLLPRAVSVGVTTSDLVTTYGPYRWRTKDRGYRAIV
jgi:hypothetical protein